MFLRTAWTMNLREAIFPPFAKKTQVAWFQLPADHIRCRLYPDLEPLSVPTFALVLVVSRRWLSLMFPLPQIMRSRVLVYPAPYRRLQ